MFFIIDGSILWPGHYLARLIDVVWVFPFLLPLFSRGCGGDLGEVGVVVAGPAEGSFHLVAKGHLEVI